MLCVVFTSSSKSRFNGKVIFDIVNSDCSTVGCAEFEIRVETDKGKVDEFRTEATSHLEYEYDATLYVWAQAVAIIKEPGNEVSIRIFKEGELIAENRIISSAEDYGNTIPAHLFSVVAKHIVE